MWRFLRIEGLLYPAGSFVLVSQLQSSIPKTARAIPDRAGSAGLALVIVLEDDRGLLNALRTI